MENAARLFQVEHLAHPSQGFPGAARVHGRKYKMSGLHGFQRDPQGFGRANLTDQDDVGLLPERIVQPLLETAHMMSDLLLRHE